MLYHIDMDVFSFFLPPTREIILIFKGIKASVLITGMSRLFSSAFFNQKFWKSHGKLLESHVHLRRR